MGFLAPDSRRRRASWPCARARLAAWARGCATVAILAGTGGCGDDIIATLVALPGCGLGDVEVSALRVVPRGDFPASAAQVRVFTRDGTLPDVPDEAAALTAEGQFGDFTVAVGRTARLDDPGDRLSVYFAPEDQLCAVASGVDFRDVGAMAVGPRGDVLIVGGRDRNGRLVDDVIHARDVVDVVTPLDRGMSSPLTGLALVPIGERRFAAIGGARADGTALDTWVPIDLDHRNPVGAATRIVIDGIDTKRGYHAAAVLPDGRVLVTGGCNALDLASRCVPSDNHVFATGFIADTSVEPPVFVPAPPMGQKRFGHELLVARDGTVLAVGGYNAMGEGIATIERWHPDAPAWTSFGGDFTLQRIPGTGPTPQQEQRQAVVGATLLEGGLLVIALSDGTLAWVDDEGAGRWPNWCVDDDGRCFHEFGDAAFTTTRRQLLTLPGERVFADTWLLPLPMLASDADDAVDLSLSRLGQSQVPPVRRTQTSMVPLADGSVLVAGGRDPDTLEPVQPFLVRLRPRLDGPDENLPGVDTLSPASFVVHDPDAVQFAGDHLELSSTGTLREMPAVWAHVRAFRSRSFRFDVTLAVTLPPPPEDPDPGDGAPAPPAPPPPAVHLVLSQGAVARTSIRFDTRIVGIQRDALGEVTQFTCAPQPPDFVAGPQPLQVLVRPGSIEIRQGGVGIAQCPVATDAPSAIGIGISGEGMLSASAMKLTRI